MVHSFHEDELSRSILSGKSKNEGGRRESLISGKKESDPVVDWKEAINQKEQANHGKFRTQASHSEVSEFLNKQDGNQEQLDAVSEVDSQMGATPFNQVNQEHASFGKSAKRLKTPREQSAQQIQPAQLVKEEEAAMGHLTNT